MIVDLHSLFQTNLNSYQSCCVLKMCAWSNCVASHIAPYCFSKNAFPLYCVAEHEGRVDIKPDVDAMPIIFLYGQAFTS